MSVLSLLQKAENSKIETMFFYTVLYIEEVIIKVTSIAFLIVFCVLLL